MSTARADIHHRRLGIRVQLLDDLPCGIQQAAGGVELDNQALIMLGGGLVNGPRNLHRRRRPDCTVYFDQADLFRRKEGGRAERRGRDGRRQTPATDFE